jgi:hypothetical protein
VKAIETMKNWYAAREEFSGRKSDGTKQPHIQESDDEESSSDKK